MSSNETEQLLRRGIDAARDGRKEEARRLLEQVTERDENNEKAWFWLASVVNSDEERRICLNNVLRLNPNNERAQRALALLQTKAPEAAKTSAANADDDEVAPGVSRRQVRLIAIIGGGAIALILVIVLVIVVGNNTRIANENAAATAAAQAASATAVAIAQAQAASTSTAEALAVIATETAGVFATQTATITPASPTPLLATLPPTWTPIPTATVEVAVLTGLDPALDLDGRIAVWSGRDLLGRGFLDVGYYDLTRGNEYTRLVEGEGQHVSLSPDAQRIAFTAYDAVFFSSTIEAVVINSRQIESFNTRWGGRAVLEARHPRYGADRISLVFVAKTPDNTTSQIFLLRLDQSGDNALQQLTNDQNAEYTFPALSPDGTQIVVVRTVVSGTNIGTDLVRLDVNSRGLVPVTNDGASTIETHPRYTRDGSQIIFIGQPAGSRTSDIFVTDARGGSAVLPLYRDPYLKQHPVLSPDGRYIAFASDRGEGNFDIFIYDTRDETLRQLTYTRENDFPGDWWIP